jgi:uncharacterized protein HemY
VALFKKSSDTNNAAEQARRDTRKARPWFERARTVADARNYDYAIECFVNGLRYDPEALDQHEALREVALRRKVNNGKPAGFLEQMKHSGGKSAIDKMLNAEYLWSKDPFNANHALGVMEQAAEAGGLEELAYWVGGLVLESIQNSKKPSKQMYLKVRDLFARIGAYDKAVEACQYALSLDQQNMALVRQLKDLQAEATMMTGRYDEEEGGFRKSIRDEDKQRQLAQEDAIATTDSAKDEVIERARKVYQDNPEDVEAMQKLVRALLAREEEPYENEAIEILEQAYQQTGQYRFRMQVGDVKIRQLNRQLRAVNQQLKKNPNDSDLRNRLRELASKQVRFELEEYGERVKNYPTDMGLRYQLGRRQLAVKDYDAAIASFQEAQGDPKHRAAALRYLGEAFAAKGWFDEAIDTFRRGIESHPAGDDRLGLELRYHLMGSLESKAQQNKDAEAAQEAAKLASQIAQSDINFRDIRKRVEALRNLVNELKQQA